MARVKYVGSTVNILRFVDLHVRPEHIEEGKAWYRGARQEAGALASTFGVDLQIAVALQAAYSINNTWSNTRGFVYRTLERWANGDKAPGTGLVSTVGMVHRVLHKNDPDQLTGNKVRDFYQAILTGGNHPRPVIDRWMARIFLDDMTFQGTVNTSMYHRAQGCYIEAAGLLNHHPADLQAVAWCAVRGTGV